MAKTYFAEAAVTPQTVLAGDSVEFTVRLVLGPDFQAKDSRIIFDLPGYMGYSRPSVRHQEDSGTVDVFCSNPDIRYKYNVWDLETGDFVTSGKSGHLGMAQRLVVLDLIDGEAAAGDEIVFKWGYLVDGFSVGTKVTTLVLKREFYNTINVRYFLSGETSLPDWGRSFPGYTRPQPAVEIKLPYRVLPREAVSLRLVHRPQRSNLLALDRFRNIALTDPAEAVESLPPGKLTPAGSYEMTGADVQVVSKKLPLVETPRMNDVYQGLNIYFGDMHTHSVFSIDCIERERMELTPADMLAYARDVACIDFMAITDHHEPWNNERHRLSPEHWEKINEMVAAANEPGRFVAFPGFEYRCQRGDTTIVLNERLTYQEIDLRAATNIVRLWEEMRGRDYIAIPHFHNPGKLPIGEWYQCPYPGVEPVLEIFSCHGSYERDDVQERHIATIKKFRPDRHGRYFLDAGMKYGFVANSDGHKGNPGHNGLTAVYAKELTREAILEAIRARRVYGTTNARIRLLFTINGQLMGSILPATAQKNIAIDVRGEQPFKAIDIFRNGVLYQRHKPYEKSCSLNITVEDEGNSYWYVRATQIDNHIAYSSPIWFENSGEVKP